MAAGEKMQIDGQTYYSEELLSCVLANHALTLVRVAGPGLADELRVLAQIARDLDLPSATRFEQLVNIAERGLVRDLERAALTVLTQVD